MVRHSTPSPLRQGSHLLACNSKSYRPSGPCVWKSLASETFSPCYLSPGS
jgi:hypothetical protein